jgi:hypothetical protein
VARQRRVIESKVLPGQPLTGLGIVCCHFFMPDANGVIIEPNGLSPALDEQGEPIRGKIQAGPMRGRLACNPRRRVAPIIRNGVTTVTRRSDDPRAVTCLKCKATKEYQEAMERLKATTRHPRQE